MEDYLYVKIKNNWHYVHPLNKLFTKIDYVVEEMARMFKKPIFLRQIKFRLKKRLHL